MATRVRPAAGAGPAGGRTPAPGTTPAAAPSSPAPSRGTTTKVVNARGDDASSAGSRLGAGLSSASSTIASNGGGFVLAVFVWAWVGLPLLQGGPKQVRNVLRAKFLNKGPDGGWLP